MSIEVFISKKFHSKSRELIDKMNLIVEEYQRQGFVLTLRQLYYQLVARDIVENTQKSYKRVGSIVNDARLAGEMDWSAIEDRTRNLRTHNAWNSPSDLIESALHAYKEDLWTGQRFRLEVWIEKDALLGVIENVCREYRVPYFACRGNNSQSEQYKAGARFREYAAEGLTPIVLHLGDHDPNGLDMTRDNQDRLSLFAGAPVEVRRIALNIDQVRLYDPPPNPAKETDTRYTGYVRQFGAECWELDALSPAVIEGLIREQIAGLIDDGAWNAARAQENEKRSILQAISANWTKVENIAVTEGWL